MVNHTELRWACRARLKTLAVCTTGATSLAATATGYTRAAGSFLTDGFAAGMEVAPTGFTQTDTGVVTAVSATLLTIDGGRTAEAEASGRTLAVGLPADRAWENDDHQPTTNVPYVVEEYLPGAATKRGLGRTGFLEATPLYVVTLYAMWDVGADAASRYADALLSHFASDTILTQANGGTARVRSDVAPSVSPLLRADDRAAVTVTIPLIHTSANAA